MKKTAPKKSASALSDFVYSALAVTSLFSLVIVGFAIWMQIKAKLNPQPGMEFGFIIFYPFVLAASGILFINGVILLVRSVRRRQHKRNARLALAGVGLLFIAPGAYLATSFIQHSYIQTNAARILSNQDALKLVQECKAEAIYRENYYSDTGPHKLLGKIYLKDSVKTQAEKDSYFYGYRSFNPDYYEELYEASQTPDLRQKCGYTKHRDDTRDQLPETYKWVTAEEAKQVLEVCSVSAIITEQPPKQELLSQASNPESKTGVFMYLKPIPQGDSALLYLGDASSADRATILDFANEKRKVCVYGLPHIVETQY